MKILLISLEYPPQLGGAGMFTHRLAESLFGMSIDVDVLTGSYATNTKAKKKDNFPWKVIRLSPLQTKLWPLFLPKKIKKISKNYNQIISCNYQSAIVLGNFKKYPFKNQYVTQVFHGRDFRYLLEKPFLREKILIPNSKSFLNRLYRVDRLIAVSNSLKSDMLNFGYPENKVDVIHHGIKIESGSRIKIPKQLRKFLLVGRVEHEKNILDCIKFIRFYNARNENKLSLSIVGNGGQLGELRQYIEAHKIENIYLLGAKSEDELLKLYETHHGLFSFSEKETFGLVFLEALKTGCIIFSRENSSISEIIDDKKDGFILNTRENEELEMIIKKLDSSSIKKIINNGFQKLEEKFDVNIMAKKYIHAKDNLQNP